MVRTIVVVGLLVVVALAVGYGGIVMYAPRAVASFVQKAKTAGYPVTLEELDAWYTPPSDGTNAADLYVKAFELNEKSEEDTSSASLPYVGDAQAPNANAPLSEPDRAAMAAYLVVKADTLKALHEAASVSSCRYPFQMRDPKDLALPHLGSLRNATQLLALEAIVRAEESQNDDAVNALVAGYSAASSIRGEPLLVSQLARASYVSTLSQALERVLNRTDLDSAQLGQVLNAVALAEAPHAYERAFAGERCLGIAGLPTEEVGVAEDGSVSAFGHVYGVLGLRRLDMWVYLGFMRDLVAAAEMPLHQRREAYAEWTARVEGISGMLPLSKRALGEFAKATTADLRTTAMLRVARVAVAIQLYRFDTKSLPNSLDALVPRYVEVIPGDPFAPGPLLFARVGIRTTLRSLGPDGIEDSGLSTDDDIVVTVQH